MFIIWRIGEKGKCCETGGWESGVWNELECLKECIESEGEIEKCGEMYCLSICRG